MFSIAKSKTGTSSAYYYNYYSRDAIEPGRWYGKGAELLGLSGIIKRDEFINILDGYSKDRTKALVQNAGESERVKFHDLTGSVPKSLGIKWGVGSEQTKREIEKSMAEKIRE